MTTYAYNIGQAVRHRTTGQEAHVTARDTHWHRGTAYRLRFIGAAHSHLAWWPEDDLAPARPPPGASTAVEDDAEFTAGLPDPFEDSTGG